MFLENWYLRRKLKEAYNNMNNDKKGTILGVVLSALIALQVDYGKVLHLDPAECGKVAAAITTALLGYYMNKKDTKKVIAADAAVDKTTVSGK